MTDEFDEGAPHGEPGGMDLAQLLEPCELSEADRAQCEMYQTHVELERPLLFVREQAEMFAKQLVGRLSYYGMMSIAQDNSHDVTRELIDALKLELKHQLKAKRKGRKKPPKTDLQLLGKIHVEFTYRSASLGVKKIAAFLGISTTRAQTIRKMILERNMYGCVD